MIYYSKSTFFPSTVSHKKDVPRAVKRSNQFRLSRFFLLLSLGEEGASPYTPPDQLGPGKTTSSRSPGSIPKAASEPGDRDGE